MTRRLTTLSILLCLFASACGSQSSTLDPRVESTIVATTALPVPARILTLGDSITAAGAFPGGYRAQLMADLQALGDQVELVGGQHDQFAPTGVQDHEGHDGFWIDNLRNQTKGWLRQSSPNIVLVMAGTNDIVNGEGKDAPAELAKLIKAIASNDSSLWIVVSTICPLRDYPDEVKAFNAAIPDIVGALHAKGIKVSFADTASAVTLSDLKDDGVHPYTASAYASMGQKWALAVDDVITHARG